MSDQDRSLAADCRRLLTDHANWPSAASARSGSRWNPFPTSALNCW